MAMSFFDMSDLSDLPRTIFFRDSSRRYKGLSSNCSFTPQIPICRPLPPRRDSAITTSLRFTKLLVDSTSKEAKVVTISPLTGSDIPATIAARAVARSTSTAKRLTSTLLPLSSQTEFHAHELAYNFQHPFVRLAKATEHGSLIGAAGFLTHEAGGLQANAPLYSGKSSTFDEDVEQRLGQNREEVLQGDYDLWHIYFAFILPAHRHTSAWIDMISWGLLQADEAGKRVYVQASPDEWAVYETLGFKLMKVARLLVDGEEGEKGTERVRYLMLRPAKA